MASAALFVFLAASLYNQQSVSGYSYTFVA